MTVECACAGLWLAFAPITTDIGRTDGVYRVERMEDGSWTVQCTLPRLDIETERFGGFPTLRDALRAVDRDRRSPYAID